MRKKILFVGLTSLLYLPSSADAAVTWNGSEGVSNQVFSVHCTGCHGSGGNSPNLTSISAASVAITDIITFINLPSTNPNAMPQGGPQMNSTLRTLVSDWSGDGTPLTANAQVSTLNETNVSKTSATLNGQVKENGVNTSFRFIYSTVNNYASAPSQTSTTSPSGSGGDDIWRSVNRSISGLNCGTTYYYWLTATSNGSAVDTSGGNLNTTACSPPTIQSISNRTATYNSSFSYNVQVNAGDSSSYTYSFASAPAGMAISNAGVISWTPTSANTTSVFVNVRVTDGNGLTDTESFNITINVPPVIAAIPNTNASEGNALNYNVSSYASDPNSTALTYSLDGTSLSAGMAIGASSGVISWTPGANPNALYNVTVTASDGSLSDTDEFTITVNRSPNFSAIGPFNINETDLVFNAAAAATDPDTNTLSYSLDATSLSNGFAIDSSGNITWTIGDNPNASYALTVTASDGISQDASTSFNVNVTPENDPPVLNAISNVNTSEGQTFNADADAVDPEGTTLEYFLLVAPTGMTIDLNTGEITWTIGSNPAATNNVTVEAREIGNGLSDTTSFTISVNVNNDPPVLDFIPNAALAEGQTFSYNANATDPDNVASELSYSLLNAPTGMSIDPATGVITWATGNNPSASNQVEVQVTDTDSATDSQQFTVTVALTNDAPAITFPVSFPTTATEDTLYSYAVTVNDPDDASFTYSLSNQPTGMAISNAGVITWTPTEGVTNSGNVVLTVRDRAGIDGLEDTFNFSLAVTAVNDPPVITSTAGTTATEDLEYQYQLSVTDPDDSVFIYSITGAPTGMQISNTGLVAWTPTESVTTSGSITVTVRDRADIEGLIDEETFTISVTAVNDGPIITSSPSTSALENNLYTYALTIDDPDDANNGTDLAFELVNGIGDMAISNTGVLTWTPENAISSSGEIEVIVRDGGEDSATEDSQLFTINVGIFNSPPSITSTAGTAATEDTEYSYQVAVDDIDDVNNGADILFALTNAPSGMSVSAMGLITWTPLESVLESGTVTITVTDGGEDAAAAAVELFSISVTAVNDAPLITSTAPTAVVEGNPYQYSVSVVDSDDSNDGTELDYQLSNSPAGMTISELGVINWTPAEGTRTSGAVTITVSDGGEDSAAPAIEIFTITVSEFNTAPQIISTAITNAIEDQLYSYQLEIDDIDDSNNGTDLSFQLNGAPTGMDINSTGLLTWIPSEGVLNSGDLTVTVSDGGEDNSAPAQQNFSVSVTPVNDAPVITSTAPTAANSGTQYLYQVEVNDPDDSNNGVNLAFNLSNAPVGMSVSSTGLVTWTPDATSPNPLTIILTVTDGGENGAQSVNETITITVNFDNDNDNIANGLDNCPDIANTDQSNFDSDTNGDVCDEDDDNDTLPDTFELANGLDPFNAADAAEDTDGDGQTNLEEFEGGSNPTVDDIGPVITPPRNLIVPAVAQLTPVELGQAIATDSRNGPITATANITSNLFEAGRHTVEWVAVDSQGNSSQALQTIEVLPIITVPSNQFAGEGSRVTVRIELTGDAPNDIASVGYRIGGTADRADHSAQAGSLTFTAGVAQLSFDIFEDDIANEQDTIEISFRNPVDSVLGDVVTHTVHIVEENIPPSINLNARQNSITTRTVAQSDGLVVVEANVRDANGQDSFTYDWSASDSRIIPESNVQGPDNTQFIFDPSLVNEGLYLIEVSVSDTIGSSRADILINVSSAATPDTNGNGIDDRNEHFNSRFLLQTSDANNAPAIETDPQLIIELGSTARYANKNGGYIDMTDLNNFGNQGAPASNTNAITPISDIFDFIVRNLPSAGASIRVTLPLTQALPASSEYYKFINNSWRPFVENDNNAVSSAPLIGGACPAPSSKEYDLGLNEGDQCIRLNIEDGGPNDADGVRNGVVKDPGAVVQTVSSNPIQDDSSNSGGGGSIGLTSFLLLLWFMWLRHTNQIHTINKKLRVKKGH